MYPRQSRNSTQPHARAVAVLDAYLAACGVKHQAADKPVVVNDVSVSGPNPFDRFATSADRRMLALAVRSSAIKGNEKPSSTTHTWLERRRLLKVMEWAERQSVAFEPLFVYVMSAKRPNGLPLFEHEGRAYHIRAVAPSRFLGNAGPRAPESWVKVQVLPPVFTAISFELLDALVVGRQEDAA